MRHDEATDRAHQTAKAKVVIKTRIVFDVETEQRRTFGAPKTSKRDLPTRRRCGLPVCLTALNGGISYHLGIGARAIVLAGHLLNSFIRKSESRCERLFSRYQQDTSKNTSKSGGWDRRRTNGYEQECTRKCLFFKGFRALRERLRTL
jgi:hypothetical protein